MPILNDLPLLLRNIFDPDSWLGIVSWGAVFVVVAWLAGRAVRLAVQRALDGHAPQADPTAVKFLGQLARLSIFVVALLSYVYEIPVLRQLGGVWLTSVGVVSVIVGIAAQSTLGNLISGVSLLLYRPFRFGDCLQVMTPSGLESGVVESLTLGYTTLRTEDNRKVVIPNSVMASQTCTNISHKAQRAAALITLTLGYNADICKARTILTELAKAHPNGAELASCRVSALSDSGTTMTLTVWCADAATAAAVKSELLEGAKKRFDLEGLPLAH